MTFKIVKAASDAQPDFSGTQRAGTYLRNNVGKYKKGAGEGTKLLEDLHTKVLVPTTTIMIDGSGKRAHLANGKADSKLNLSKDETGRKYKMSLPDGSKINTKYVEGILKVLQDKFIKDKAKPTDTDMKDFMLGLILLSKCR